MQQDYDLQWKIADGEHLRMCFSGSIAIANAGEILERCKQIALNSPAKKICWDFAQVKYLDTAGASLLFTFRNFCKQREIYFETVAVSDSAGCILKLFDDKLEQTITENRPRDGIITQIGIAAWISLKDAREAIAFVGELAVAFWKLVKHPARHKWQDSFLYMEQAGADAVPIVLLINFLLGLIMAFQASVQLRQFGANIFVADLVGLAMVRELGPLMTALIIAGRSGSAFAAEIGTMKVSEEVDALVTMGFEPIRFLVMPKMLAVIIMMPCLTLFADIVGVFGGGIIGVVSLDLTVFQYIHETYKAVGLNDILSGLGKSVIFGILISAVGCFRGFQVKGGAQGVGRCTTSAVVTSKFFILLADAVYTMIGHFYPG